MSTPGPRLSISIFFPAFNDGGTIGKLVHDASEVLKPLTDEYEILVINDGSTDNTREVLETLSKMEPHLRVINHGRNLGYGAALRTGFQNVTKELVFYTDGDGQYDVRQLVQLHQLLTDQVDVVNGFKIKRADGLTRKIAGALYNQSARVAFGVPVRDIDCDFRLLRGKYLQNIELETASGAICIELIHKLARGGARFAEMPVEHSPRVHGQSQFFTLRSVTQTLSDFLWLWWRLVLAPRFRVSSDGRKQKSTATG